MENESTKVITTETPTNEVEIKFAAWQGAYPTIWVCKAGRKANDH